MNPPIQLRCEYFENPLAIDVPRPRLSWLVNDDRAGAKQTAYQILVTRCEVALWDSGKVQSDQSTHVVYDGAPLQSRMHCDWKVRTWDVDDQPSEWSATAFWEMGLLQRIDWKAKWIGSPIVGGPYSIPPVPLLRKRFSVEKQIRSARLNVTAMGLHECYINGKRVGDDVFTPGRTEYTKRVPYHVYDVTNLVQSGANCVGAILGDGWYCGHLHSDPRQTYGDRPRLLAQLEVRFADGTTQVICSDETWEAGEGAIRSSDMLMGEDYDARVEVGGWTKPTPSRGTPGEGRGKGSFNSSAQDPHANPLPEYREREQLPLPWRAVVTFHDPGIDLVAQRSPPVRRIQEIKPIAPPRVSANKRRHLFDMGQNMVGWVRLRFRNAPPGKTVDLRYTEMLDKDGKPYTTALRSARATDHYTTRGGDEETFEPRFTFHGFRYVEVRDYPGTPTVDDLSGVVIHSDCEMSGEFECSDPLVNQLQHNILWSQKGNFIDIPTDCPQRDERLGWTGDAQVFVRTAAYNMNVAGFFTKWLQDVADAQYEDGHIPSVVPHVKSIHHEGGPAWADAVIICPWWLYQSYGDTRILEDRWENMTRFMRWMETNYPDFIRPKPGAKWQGYGDWLSIGAVTPPDLIGTAFFAYDATLMSKMAEAIGRSSEADEYADLFQKVSRAWNNRFVNKGDANRYAAANNSIYEQMGVKPSGDQADKNQGDPFMAASPLVVQTQTAYVLALHFDLLPDHLRPAVFLALVKDIESRGMHLSTGFVGTPYLNHVLTRFGRPDMAYALLMQKTFPSWLFPVTHGATTMWERWDGWTPENGFNDAGMNSYNHYAYGAVGDWMYSTIAGIDIDPEKPGYKHIIIRPIPGGGLTHARGKLRSMYGVIESEWRLNGTRFELTVQIPPNTTAKIIVPAGETVEVGAGRHEFVSTIAR